MVDQLTSLRTIELTHALYPLIWDRLQPKDQVIAVVFSSLDVLNRFIQYKTKKEDSIPSILVMDLSSCNFSNCEATHTTIELCKQQPHRIAIIFGIDSNNKTNKLPNHVSMQPIYIASILVPSDEWIALQDTMCFGCFQYNKLLKQCQACKKVKYCSSKCQCLHWGIHKYICSTLSKIEEPDG